MNIISEQKADILMDCFLSENMSIREAARKAGVAKQTAHTMRTFCNKAMDEYWDDYDGTTVRFEYRHGRKFKMIEKEPNP